MNMCHQLQTMTLIGLGWVDFISRINHRRSLLAS